jgi:hypothetical protein
MKDVAGIVVAVYAAVIGRACWTQGNAGARLAALLALNLAIWLLIAVADPHAAGQLAGWLSQGITEDAHGIGSFIGKL